MTKGRRSNNSRTRDAYRIAKTPLRSYPQRPQLPSDFTRVQDTRLFHPKKVFQYAENAPLFLTRPKSRVVARRVQVYSPSRSPITRLHFSNPARVLVCIRRKIRKQVLHAFRKTGKGGQKRPLRTRYRDISC